MSKRTEIKWQTEICKVLKASGCYARKMQSQFQKGFPDLFVAQDHCEGAVTLFEVKLLNSTKLQNFDDMPNGRSIPLTQLQIIEMSKLRCNGVSVYVLVVLQAADVPPDSSLIGIIIPPDPGKDLHPKLTNARRKRFAPWGEIKASSNPLSAIFGTTSYTSNG